MSANIKASVDGTQAIIGVGGVDQMTVSNAGVVTANSFVGLNNSSVTATGSTTARTLANRFADVVNVKDFGAVGDGIANDTAAFQNAISLLESINSGVLYIPEGTYKIYQTLVIDNANIYIKGDGYNYSRLIFNGSIDGIVFNLLASGLDKIYQQACVSDIAILSTNQNYLNNISGSVVSNFGCRAITYNPTSSQQGSPYPTCEIFNVYIGGENGFENFWNTGIYLVNANSCRLDNITINGFFNNILNPSAPTNLNYQAMVAGVVILDRSVQVVMSNTKIGYAFYGIYIYSSGTGTGANRGFEGLQLESSSIVGVIYGVHRTIGASADSARPMTVITGCHFNSYFNSIYLIDATETVISNNLFYTQSLFQGFGTPNNPPPAGAANIVIGSQYFPTTTSRHTITGNIFRNLSFQPIVRGLIINVTNSTISNCVFDGDAYGMDIGIILQANAKNTTITGCVFTSCSNEIQNGGDNSNRYSPVTNMPAGENVNAFNKPNALNTSFGTSALKSITTGLNNTAIGFRSLDANNSGSFNNAIGVFALRDNTLGSDCVAIGNNALLLNNSGYRNTSIGNYSLSSNTSGQDNTAIGVNALSNLVNFTNCTGLGRNSQVSGSNQIRIGDTNVTSVTCQTNSWSDERDKADIIDSVLGLDFIKELRPVDFRWDYREDYRPEAPKAVDKPIEPREDASEENKSQYQVKLAEYNAYVVAKNKWLEDCKWSNLIHDGTYKRTRFHHGLIAQEVKKVIERTGVDFGGFQDHTIKGGDEVMTIGYIELIAPLIKAIQELAKDVEELKNK